MDPFNSMPPPDAVRLAKEIRSAVKAGVIELQKFSDSIRRASSPAWPRAEILDRFVRQIEHFRLISDRRPDASPMQCVSDMDHRWKSLSLRQTLDNAVSQLERFLGRFSSGEIYLMSRSRQLSVPFETARQVLNNERVATQKDLNWMIDFAPDWVRKINQALDFPAESSRKHLMQVLASIRTALPRLAQHTLVLQQRQYLLARDQAAALRRFLFDLKHPAYKQRIFGLTDPGIATFAKLVEREEVLRRVRRHRANKKERRIPLQSEPRHSSRSRAAR